MSERSTIEAVLRDEYGRIVALLARTLQGDLELAQDAVQAATVAALEQWPDNPPDQPAAWLVRTARNKAIDTIRRRSTWSRKAELLKAVTQTEALMPDIDDSRIPDERLRLICTCCHPALSLEAQVALTLRTLCGLTTLELARSFLVDPRAMAQRLVRAKRKIVEAGIPYEVPEPGALNERLGAILHVVYLVFNEGYGASTGEGPVRADLCDEALRLGELLVRLVPDESEVHGLLALMLFQDARRSTRTDDHGRVVLLRDQERERWDRSKIATGFAALGAATRRGPPGTYTLQAAIASVHARARHPDETNWNEIIALYDLLMKADPSPVVALNRAAAISIGHGPAAGLRALDALTEYHSLERHHLWWSARADVLRRLHRVPEAVAAYRQALTCVGNEAERQFIEGRIQRLLS